MNRSWLKAMLCLVLLGASAVALSPPAAATVTITGFTPTRGPVGTAVTITGTGFPHCSTSTITFAGGIAAPCTFVSPTTLRTVVPAFARSGPITVNAVASSASYVVSLGLALASTSTPPGGRVGLSGSRFDPDIAVDVYLDSTDEALASTDDNGNFSYSSLFTVPASTVPGRHWITAVERGATGKSAQVSIAIGTTWAQDGFDSRHTGWNTTENVLNASNVADLTEQWATRASSRPYHGSVVVDPGAGPNGTVFAGGVAGLSALDATTGATLWTSGTDQGVYDQPPALAGGHVWVGLDSGSFAVFPTACARRTCAAIGHPAAGASPFGAAVVSGNVVYFADHTNGVDAYPASCTGACRPLWTGTSASDLQYGAAAPVVLPSGTVVVSGYDNTTTGGFLAGYPTSCTSACAPSWVNTNQNPGASFPFSLLYAAGRIFVVGSDELVYAFLPGTGNPLWISTSFQQSFGQLSFAAGMLFTTIDDGQDSELYAIRPEDGTIVWGNQLIGQSPYTQAAIAGGTIFVDGAQEQYPFHSDLEAFPLACGPGCQDSFTTLIADQSNPGPPAVVNGSVYETTADGIVHAYGLGSPPAVRRPSVATLRPTVVPAAPFSHEHAR